MEVLAADGYMLEETLDRCDAMLISGGEKIYPYHFQAVQHAVQNRKSLLGIHLGMQVIHTYSVVEDEANRRGYIGDLLDLYQIMERE